MSVHDVKHVGWVRHQPCCHFHRRKARPHRTRRTRGAGGNVGAEGWALAIAIAGGYGNDFFLFRTALIVVACTHRSRYDRDASASRTAGEECMRGVRSGRRGRGNRWRSRRPSIPEHIHCTRSGRSGAARFFRSAEAGEQLALGVLGAWGP
ncbi:hypothetical protein CC85DRAFT_206132 [Cutaneotrichosporon oleaginosum]|uniref:Uncharacterized protein n=1 Tax=Cutaneotrichosporon oleaginosum TaxID=879819 RepID=A0A0J0XDT3_9TREE|nr:uncharacterized protein CC85DRAFT_206132 [Cutaneotrichosporon oleaginosum]KLT39178.1 hypothetical protein CC85DRAFT_206132 [Cutaneotrichosporon oleaginosum]TXT05304.1 hypothetical protein COLE_06624 [Cutaneotrichosporon oleaginosum]